MVMFADEYARVPDGPAIDEIYGYTPWGHWKCVGKLMHRMAATGSNALTESELLDALVPAMSRKNRSRSTERGTPDSGFVDRNNFVLALGSTIPLSSPTTRAVWRTDPRMAIYHNEAGMIQPPKQCSKPT